MIKRTRSELNKCIVHKVANKFNTGQNSLSEQLIKFDEESYELFLPFLLKPFGSVTQSYRFNHLFDNNLNKINKYSKEIFEDEKSFIKNSKNIVNHLYEQSNSANIKTGDVIVAYFEGLEYKDVLVEAVGVFKIESKVDFFQTYLDDEESYDVAVQKGISSKKLDKGCLILNSSDFEGNVVLSVDNNNYDTQYWIKNFLDVKYANDRNLHTYNYINLCKEFSEEVIKLEFGKHEQSKFLANTVDYFKENESIDIADFQEQTLLDKQKNLFKEYIDNFQKSNDLQIENNFEVSDLVFKKEKSKLKTEIKLDTKIQIKIDVDSPDASAEYLERGFDESKKMKFYKVFFNSEK